MVPWITLDKVPIPGTNGELTLLRHGAEFSIRVNCEELMTSRAHASEEALAELACKRIAGRAGAEVLVGGLGMGYTAAAALKALRPDGKVIVAELLPSVIRWNRHELAELTGKALVDNDRVIIREIELGQMLREARPESFDAILLDVDNGPEALTRSGNSWLYSKTGLATAKNVLRPEGILAVWSATFNNAFVKLLRGAGFDVDEVHARARNGTGGKKHTIWLAEKKKERVPSNGNITETK